MEWIAQDAVKKRKKTVYKGADVAPPAKRFKPILPANDIPDLTANEVLDEEPVSPPKPKQVKQAKKKQPQLPKKKKQIARPKKKNDGEEVKTNQSPLLLILFGLIRKCRQDKRDAKMTSTIEMRITRAVHSTHQSYFKIEISTSPEMNQDDVDRTAALLNSNVNQTPFANLDRTIQVRTAERSSGIQKEWIIEEGVPWIWQAKQTRPPIEPQRDLISLVTLYLYGDVYGEFYSIEPVLEECLLFNPFIAVNYQLDNNPAVALRGPVEYKPQLFKDTVLSSVAAYYAPEQMVVKPAGNGGKSLLHVLVNCMPEAKVDRSFMEVKIIQDGLVVLPNAYVVEQLLNKNWDGDHGIGIELEEMIVKDVPIGYYIRTSGGELSTISNILVIVEHNVPCKPFDTDRPIIVGPVMEKTLVDVFKELKENNVELSSKREMAKLADFQVAADELTASVSDIIETSTNAEFIERCMQRLQANTVEDLRPALQNLIATSIEEYMPPALKALNQN